MAAWALHGRPLPHARLAVADVTQHPDGSLSETHAFLAGLAGARRARAARTLGTIDLGGSAAADEAAHERDWPAAIRFILTH